jgi:hypothetical protein
MSLEFPNIVRVYPCTSGLDLISFSAYGPQGCAPLYGQGTSFGAPCELENVLAKMVIERVPSVEMVRFVNSGTEACLSVLRLMRAYTKRDKVRSVPRKHALPRG